MADLADVENQLKALIVGWCYPNGTSQPSAMLLNGKAVPVKVGRGWPLADTLAQDLQAQVANVTIYSQPGAERLTTRYPRQWQVVTAPSPTLTATVSGRTVTIGGTVSSPQNVALIYAGIGYVYAVQAADTVNTVAAALSALVPGATSFGPVITAPGGYRLAAHVGGFGTAIRELRRQERLFQVTCWCATPEQRDALAGFIDAKFAGAGDPNGLEFITLPDGSAARLKYVRTAPTDRDALVQSYRRDLIYSVEYATTETLVAPQVTAFETRLEDASSNIISDHTV